MAALVFPFVGGAGAVANRLSDVAAQDSAQLLEGEVPIISTMVDAAGNPIAWIYTQRRWVVPGDRIADTMKLAIVSIEDRRFGVHNGVDLQGSLTGLAGYLRGAVDTRGGSTIEQQYVKNYNFLVNAQNEARAAGGGRDHSGAQAARDADGAGTRQGAAQGGDPDPVSEPGVVRQRQLRRAGGRAHLLRCQCGGPQLAAGGAAGGDGAVHERAQPLHQSRRRPGATESRARHPDRQRAGQGRRDPRRQGAAAGRPAQAQPAAAGLHRGRRSRVLLRLRAVLSRSRRHRQGGAGAQRLPDPHHARPEGAGLRQAGDRQGREPHSGRCRERDERHQAGQGRAPRSGDGRQPHLRARARRGADRAAAAVHPGRRRRRIGVQDLHHRRGARHGDGHQRPTRRPGEVRGRRAG